MGIIDIVLLILIGIFAVKGLIKGLVNEIFGLLALVAGYVVAYNYSHVFTKPVLALGLDEKSAGAIGYVVGFLVTYIVVVIVGAFLSKAFKEVKLGALNRGGGFLFGAIKSAVILGLILSAVITVSPKNSSFSQHLQKGVVAGRLAKVSPFVYKMMNKIPDVKKLNPFDIPQVQTTKDKLNLLENDAVNDALNAVKDTGEKAKESAKGLADDNPLKDMQKE